MKTLILRIGAKVNGPPATYPVELVEVQWSNGQPQEVVRARNDVSAEQLPGAPGAAGQAGAGARDLGGDPGPGGGGSSEAADAAALYDFVFQGAVATAWKALRTPPPGGGPAEGRCLILDVQAPELEHRRWERMGKNLDFPASRPECALVRGPAQLDLLAPARDDTLKVLVVVGSAPKDPNVLAEDEVQELEKTFMPLKHGLEYRILRQPTRGELGEALGKLRPDIFHFIGHGSIDPNSNQPFLYLHQLADQTDLAWPLIDILKDFGGFSPSFVFLNACHTVDRTDLVGAASMTDLFLTEIRAAAVLGMHAAVRGTTAGRLAGALYQALTAGQRLDLALTRARNQADILKSNDPARAWDWALPYLRVRVAPEHVLPLAPLVPRFLLNKLEQIPSFKTNAYFVDRVPQHQDLLKKAQQDPERAGNLLLVTGARAIGKTQLIRCCLEAAVRRGRLAKYVELVDPDKPLEFLDVLQRICEGKDGGLIDSPLPEAAVKRFYQVLNALHQGLNPGDKGVVESQPGVVECQEDGRWRRLPVKGTVRGEEEQVEFVFKSFLEALRAVPAQARSERARQLEEHDLPADAAQARTDKRPFLLVLDQLAIEDLHPASLTLVVDLFRKYLVPKLIKPFAAGGLKDVLLVLGVVESAITPLGLDAGPKSLGLVPPTIQVGMLAASEFKQLAEEYFLKRDIEKALQEKNQDPGAWRQFVNALGVSIGAQWSPASIVKLFEATFPLLTGQQP
jgi:hypothetical protein